MTQYFGSSFSEIYTYIATLLFHFFPFFFLWPQIIKNSFRLTKMFTQYWKEWIAIEISNHFDIFRAYILSIEYWNQQIFKYIRVLMIVCLARNRKFSSTTFYHCLRIPCRTSNYTFRTCGTPKTVTYSSSETFYVFRFAHAQNTAFVLKISSRLLFIIELNIIVFDDILPVSKSQDK